MRNFKRFLAMTLTVLMLAGCFSMISVNAFDDVYDFENAIYTLSDLNVIEGYDDTTFGPDDDVTRWQMALLISKLVTGLTDASVWYTETNTTAFADINKDQYMGSIAYANAEGIVCGTSDSTFNPDGGIMFQDALTMAVRALGFGSDDMNKGYPWKFIEKAEDLGLLNGLEYIDDTEATLTRGETAQLLYNVLYAYNADDVQLSEDVYGFTAPESMVVVLTATNRYNMLGATGVAKTDYVAFNPLNEDLTLNEGLTYYVDKAEFGIEGDADLYIGATFAVKSNNDYATFTEVELIDAGKADAVITGNVNKNTSLLTIDEQTYKVVESFSRLHNTAEYIGNYPEIVMFDKDGAYAITNGTGAYQTDAFGNLLDVNGQIALYYMPHLVGFVNPYVIINDNGAIVQANADLTQYNLAKVGDQVVGGFAILADTKADFDDINAVYDAKVYDIDADGYYDYGYFMTYEYGTYGVDANGCVTMGSIATGKKPGEIKFVDAEGNKIDAIGNGYYLFSYNAQAAVLTIKETLTVYSGYLSGLNTIANQLTLGGTVYSYGVAKLPGAEEADVEKDIKAALIGKNINYVMYDGVVIDILPVATAGYFVIDSVIGVTSSGLPTVLGYNGSNVATVVVVSTLNTYSNYIYNFENDRLVSVADAFKTAPKGTLFTAQVDTLGYYHLTVADSALKTVTAAGVVDFKNGISNVASVIGQFTTSANTVFLVFDGTTFTTRVGMPADGATITVDAGVEYLVVNSGTTAAFVYLKGNVTFAGTTTSNPWVAPANTTIVYIDPAYASATVVENSLSSVIGVDGMLLQGYTYKYSAVTDVVNGKAIDVYSVAYNAQVKAGHFYTVINGYVDKDLGTKDDVITAGYMTTATLANVNATNGTVNGVAIDRDAFVVAKVKADGNVYRVYEVDATSSSIGVNNFAAAASNISGTAYTFANATTEALIGTTGHNVFFIFE